MYDVIVGLDFGHGENAAEAIRPGIPNPAMVSLKLDEYEKEIPTVILYRDNAIRIGHKARHDMKATPYFKARPDQWQRTVSGRSQREMMRDFFRGVMENLRRYNPDEIHDGDKILLVVGYPSSVRWREQAQAYEALIREATGVPDVYVMPESRAALFSAFTQNVKIRVNATAGALVFDFGSSTADCTYMLLGKQLLEWSWTLGASEIERAMLRKVLGDNGLTMADVWEEEIGKLEIEFRAQKEQYYREGAQKAYVLELVALDGGGDLVAESIRPNGEKVYRKRDFYYRVNEAFMDSILGTVKFPIEKDGVSLGKNTWIEHCGNLFREVKEMLAARGLPCETIVLTGGASHMDFIKPMCDRVFGMEAVREDNPSHSVSKGLCFAGRIDRMILPGLIREATDRVQKVADQGFEKMITDCAADLAATAYGCVAEELRQISAQSSPITVGALKNKIHTVILQALERGVVDAAVNKTYGAWMAQCSQRVIDAANEAGQKIYRDRLTAEQFRLSLPDNPALSGDAVINVDGGGIISSVLVSVFFPAASFLFVVNPLLASYVGFYMPLNENKVLGAMIRPKLYKEFIKKTDGYRTRIASEIRTSLAKAFKDAGVDAEARRDQLAKDVERAINTLALRYFEHET